MNQANNEKELGKLIKENCNEIIIEGDLARKVVKIKAVGNAAWGVCFVALAVVIAATVATAGSGGAAAPIAAPTGIASFAVAAPTAVATMGVGPAYSAFLIAVAGGGAGILKKLRNYKLEKLSENKIVLHRK